MALHVTTGEARRRLVEHVRTPLHRDGYALALSSALTAAAGLLYWIVAANTYSAHAVGLNSALISSMMFLAGIASLNLPNIVVRFLPEAGGRTLRVVAGCYAAAGAVAVACAVIFLVGAPAWAGNLSFVRGDAALALWLTISTVAWCLFAIQDSVLTALGLAVWVPVENAAFSVVKLVLVAALAAAAPVYGIFVSWTVSSLVAVLVVNSLVARRLAREASAVESRMTVSLRDRAFARYYAADYLCSIAWVSAANLMPVIVTAVAGATANAYYALGWAVSLPLYAVAANIGMSLVLHGTHDPASLGQLTRKSAVQGARVLVPAVVVLLAVAPWMLKLFGARYGEHGATLLRLLVAGSLPYQVLVLTQSAARVRRRLRPAVIAMTAQAVLALALVGPLVHAQGVNGAGVAWLVSQCVVAAGVLIARRAERAARPSPSPGTATRV